MAEELTGFCKGVSTVTFSHESALSWGTSCIVFDNYTVMLWTCQILIFSNTLVNQMLF